MPQIDRAIKNALTALEGIINSHWSKKLTVAIILPAKNIREKNDTTNNVNSVLTDLNHE